MRNEIIFKIRNLISRMTKLKQKNVVISRIEFVQLKKRIKRLKAIITIFQKLIIQFNNKTKMSNEKSNIRVKIIIL